MRSAIAVVAAMAFFSSCLTLAPSRDTEAWTVFFDEKTELYGYRDARGNIRIPPTFIMAGAHEFHHITAVVEKTGENDFLDYYLLKTGEKVGVGCLYLWDNTPDCESEGKIRFRDAETDMVGFFDGKGRVVIPAAYSDALPFRNNLAVVLKGAQRVCPDGTPWSAENGACEHWRWQGGKSLLIDAQNRVVIEGFPHTGGLDWFSLRVSDTADPDPLRDAFKAADGRYWSFVNFEKAFAQWFEAVFLAANTHQALGECAFDEITYWDRNAGEWKQAHKDRFLKKAGDRMLRLIGQIRSGATDHAIHASGPGLNPFIFQGELYAAYFDACRNPKNWEYPVFELVVSYPNDGNGGGVSHQDVFEFLRTADGVYRLISVPMHPSF